MCISNRLPVTEKQYIDPVVGPVVIRRNPRARRISLRVNRRKEVSLTVPWLVPVRTGLAFLESRREWILATLAKVKVQEETPPQDIEMLRAKAKAQLPPRLGELAGKHGFQYRQVFIKNNRSNWGSCSVRGNINLNLRLVTLPEDLQDYVILHELCHLKQMNHGPKFHALLESVCPGHAALQKELRKYKIR